MSHSIGAIARLTDVSIATVRFYERRGLVPEPPRNAYGHRTYDSSHVSCIKFIRGSQRLGFTLAEIEELLAFREAPGSNCEEMRARTLERLQAVEARIGDLETVRDSLSSIVVACGQTCNEDECPAIAQMEA
jgi:MerR family copper efflux transcriptional regulator